MTKLVLALLVLGVTPAVAGKSAKPASAHTQAHADRASKDAAKAQRAGNSSLAASREKLAAQRQKQADQQKKKETAKARR